MEVGGRWEGVILVEGGGLREVKEKKIGKEEKIGEKNTKSG